MRLIFQISTVHVNIAASRNNFGQVCRIQFPHMIGDVILKVDIIQPVD